MLFEFEAAVPKWRVIKTVRSITKHAVLQQSGLYTIKMRQHSFYMFIRRSNFLYIHGSLTLPMVSKMRLDNDD